MSTNRPNKKNSPKQTPAPLSKLIEEMNAVIKSNPKDAAAYFNRGMIYHEQGDDKQANADYKKAVQLEPKLKAEVESYIASQQKRGENFKKIPTAVLADQLSSFLTASDMRNLAEVTILSNANQDRTRLFKPALAIKQLLNLVVRYELDEKKIQAGIEAGVNPIIQEVNALLTQDPTLALKRAHITDHSGRHFYWSPLEAAHWSGNWVLRDLILKYAQSIPEKADQLSGEMRAAEQLREWDQQSYNYDLRLMRAKEGAFTFSENTPALIIQSNEQGEDKMFQRGEVNGEWVLRQLDENTTEAFKHLNFPKASSDESIVIKRDQITTGMYDALKKYHNPTHFDLEEYCRVTDAFVKKYPAHLPVPSTQWNECNTDSYKIGQTQKKFPAWLAAVWCSSIPFHPLPDVKRLVIAPDACRLKLYYGEAFFDNRLGEIFSIYKGRLTGASAQAGPRVYRFEAAQDLTAMAAVCKVITEENDKSKQLLPGVSKSTPGFSG